MYWTLRLFQTSGTGENAVAKKTTKKTARTAKSNGKASSGGGNYKFSKADKARSKGEVFREIAEKTDLSRKQVSEVFEVLGAMIANDLRKGGPQQFTVPGLMKIQVQRKPATKAKTVPNPFRPGEMMTVKPKPARNVVKVRPLKNLKAMV